MYVKQNRRFFSPIEVDTLMEPMTITCVQCGEEFVFSNTDQEKFKAMGFDLPQRCPACRKKKFKGDNPYETRKFKNKKKYYRLKYTDDTD